MVQTIEYSVGIHTERRVVTSVVLRPGIVRQEIVGGPAVELPRRLKGPFVKVMGEEIKHKHGQKLQTLYKKLCSKMGTSQALVNAILAIVSQQFKKVIPRRFIVGKWADMGSIMVEEFPNWTDVWRNISSAAEHCKSLIDDEVVDALFRFFDYNVKQIFKFLNPSPTEESAAVLGALYTVSHGRFLTAECYTLTSALGAKHIAKCWRMASLRKKHLKRDTDYNCDIMSKIYSNLAAQAEIFDRASITGHFVFLGAHNAVFSFLESLDENSSEDMPPVHSLFDNGRRKKEVLLWAWKYPGQDRWQEEI
ncbi:uncharacterized protein LOC111872021 [Cryptotermes secundus]|uniref:uncharacterized protein LOC111872021 n=1 Tax=Cryptotermes secundus TaxID=105785 RepID=UPI000CD7D174|nr:uncharacterized protein LOC111872021 [Cryptotermes secundus]XP_023721395.1 uncharacterized protein LOC111872021 [Cryptotermes secundus]